MTSGNRTWLRGLTASLVFLAVLFFELRLLSALLNYTGAGLGDESFKAQFPANHAFFLTLQLMFLFWGTIISICLAAAAGYLTHRAFNRRK